MERGASDRVEEQSHTEMTIKTEVEDAVQSTPYSDVEITVNYVKEGPGLLRLVKSAPALLVKEEVLEVSWQDMDWQQHVEATSAPTIAGSLNLAVGSVVQDDEFNIKDELSDTDMDIGPTVLQHVDSRYGIKQIAKSMMDQNNKLDDELKRKRKLANACSKKHRKKKREEAQQLKLLSQNEPKNDNEQIQQNKLERRRELSRERSKRYRDRKRLSSIKKIEHAIDDTLIPGPSHGGPTLTIKDRRIAIHNSQIPGTSANMNIPIVMNDYSVNLSDSENNCAGTSQRTNNPDTSVVKQESTILNLIPWAGVKETIEEECGDAQHSEDTQPGQRAQSRPYRCAKCLQTFKWEKSLIVHCRREHVVETYECIECNLKYKCAGYLARHIYHEHSKQQYECTGCKKMCKSKQMLRNHVSWCREFKSAGSELRNYVCDYCQKTYKDKRYLKIHIASVHKNRTYKCRQCNKSFKRKEYVKSHTTKMHSADIQECNVCGKSVKEYQLRRHKLNCEKQVQCKLCAEVMKSKQYLHRHLKDCHGQQSVGSYRQFPCRNCGKNFKSKGNCLRHGQSGICTRPTASNTSAVASTSVQQHSVVIVKEEPADGELDLGPVVFQHMDCNYRPYKLEPQLD